MTNRFKSIILYHTPYSLENITIKASVHTAFIHLSETETYTTLKNKWSKLIEQGFFKNVEYVNTYIFCKGFLTFEMSTTVYQMTNTIKLEDFENILTKCPPPKPLIMFCYANKGLFYQSLWHLLPVESHIVTFTDEYSDIQISTDFFKKVVIEVLKGYPKNGIVNFNNKMHDELDEWEELTYLQPFYDNVENFSFNTPQLIRSIRDSEEYIRLHSILVESRIESKMGYRNIWYWAQKNKEVMEALQSYFKFMKPHVDKLDSAYVRRNPSFKHVLRHYNKIYSPEISERISDRYFDLRQGFTMSHSLDFSLIKATLWQQRHSLACFERSFFSLQDDDMEQKTEQTRALINLDRVMNTIIIEENQAMLHEYANSTIKGYMYDKIDQELAEKKAKKSRDKLQNALNTLTSIVQDLQKKGPK